MALKTFNLDSKIYEKYSKHCKKNGISMSRQVENFLKGEIEKISVNVEKNSEEKEIENNIVQKAAINQITGGDSVHPLSRYC